MNRLTDDVIEEYQKRREEECGTMGDFKELGRELRDKYDLTDREAIAVLNNIEDEIEGIFKRKRQEDGEGKKADCFQVGTSWSRVCGPDCPVYQRGDCPEPQEIEDNNIRKQEEKTKKKFYAGTKEEVFKKISELNQEANSQLPRDKSRSM